MISNRESTHLRTLQIGMSWFPEQAGNGLDRVYHALICHLPDVNVQVRGLVAGSSNTNVTSAEAVRAFASDSAPLARRLLALRKVTRNTVDLRQFDIVASHFALYTFPILDLLSSKPLVVHFHGPWAHESMVEGESRLFVTAKGALERAVYRRGARCIVLSQAFASLVHQHYGVPKDSIRIVPGGVDADRFATECTRREARERLGWPVDRPIALAVRRLARRMGLENLIEAMGMVRQHLPDAILFIAGKGPLAAELHAQIEAAGLAKHVKLLGYVPDDLLPFAYRAADLTVVPTTALEGFGLITVESLAAGTPALVTPVGGLPEVVRDLSGSLILADTHPITLGEHLTAALRGDMSLPSDTECQAYVRAHFDWPVIAARTRAVYEEVV